MIRFRSIIAFLALLMGPMSLAQDMGSQGALLDKTYTELELLEEEAYQNDHLDRLRMLCGAHVEKAKRENNTIETAKGYIYRAITEPFALGLQYADSIIWATQGSDHPQYPTKGYFIKAGNYYVAGHFREALENYATAYQFALKKGNKAQQRDISMGIAAIRSVNGQPRIAADLYQRALKLLQGEPDFERELYGDHILLLYNLSLTHLRLKQLDSAASFVQQGIDRSAHMGDRESVRDFTLVGAQVDFYNGDLEASRDTLLKYVKELEAGPKAIKYYYLGKIADAQGKPNRAITYFQKVDSLVRDTGDPFPEVREVYLRLITEAREKGQLDRQLGYIENLIHYDSLLSVERQGVQDQVVVAYDVPFLKAQRNEVLQQLQDRKKWMVGLTSLLVVFLGLVGYLTFRNRRNKRRLRELLEGPSAPLEKKPPGPKGALAVPEDIQEDLLARLEAFEDSDAFTDAKLDLPTLAEWFRTNTSYLSMVINHYKKMSFPTYLKELRISHAVARLSKEPQLLKYNYQGLAETFGFGSGDSFAKAFRERTGVYPSKFLRELEARQKHDDL
ncbi:MAG: helix-turn-helix domain-containing protein [Flavobacteriaceae bacterium]|nr:helix-turn-helix domain-containing protein [Flavobacteriaceae bacterium]